LRRALLALVLLLAGCGGAGEDERGTATLWITRDRGSEVLHEGTIPAGLTVLRALRREVEVETRYGGRFVQAIDGIEGSLAAGRDWFFFVNGVAADKGAAEYRLRPGDTAWWDYRQWKDDGEVRIVVGAFPEPFLHGYEGRRRPAAVRYAPESQEPAARAIGKLISAASVAPLATPVPEGSNAFVIRPGLPRFTAQLVSADGPYRFTLVGNADRLARDPDLIRFRYEGVP
jgi:hypothetical protein